MFPTPTRMTLSPGLDFDLISFWTLLTAASTPVLIRGVMEEMASFEDILTTLAIGFIKSWFMPMLNRIKSTGFYFSFPELKFLQQPYFSF